MTGLVSPVRMSAYSISKYGVEAFSDALRREMSQWGVLVSIIEPGRFKTNVSASIIESVKQLWDDLSPEMKKDYGEKYFHKCKSIYTFAHLLIQSQGGSGGYVHIKLHHLLPSAASA